MKKNYFLLASLALGMAFSASAEKPVALASFNGNAVEMQNYEKKVSVLPTQKVEQKLFHGKSNVVSSNLKKSNAPIMKAAAEGDAYFSIPEGAYYLGVDFDQKSYYPGGTFIPAYSNVTWKNQTTGKWATSFSWEYTDPTDITATPATLTVTTKDLAYATTTAIMATGPKLTASGSQTQTYMLQGAQSGTPALVSVGVTPDLMGGLATGLINYDASLGYTFYNVGYDDNGNVIPLSGKVNGVMLTSGITSMVTGFQKPASPYRLEDLKIPMQITGSSSSAITVTVYKASNGTLYSTDDKGQTSEIKSLELGEELGHCTKTYAELKQELSQLQDDGGNLVDSYGGTAIFDSFVNENALGYEAPVNIVVDDVIAVAVSGWTGSDVTYFVMYTNTQASDANGDYDSVADSRIPTSAYWQLNNLSIGGVAAPNTSVAFYENTNFAVFMDAAFQYLYAENTTVDMPTAGGTQTAKLDDYYTSVSDWTLTCGSTSLDLENDNLAGDLNDWLSVVAMQSETEEGAYMYSFDFSADELPADLTGRTANVVLSDGVTSLTYKVVQGEAGVSAVEGTGNKVAVVDGNFEVTAAKAGVVEVYNIAGQKVASAQVDGSAVVPAQNLAKGLYVVKFADNTVVKVMK